MTVHLKPGDKAISKPIIRGPYAVVIRRLYWTNWFVDMGKAWCASCRKPLKPGDLYGYSRYGAFCMECCHKEKEQ